MYSDRTPRKTARLVARCWLKKKWQAQTGDLEIQFKKHLLSANDERFDWSVMLRAVDGGLIETYDELMYETPVDGYKPEWTFDRRKNGFNWEWTDNELRRFYLKSRNGQVYASLWVVFRADKRPSMELMYWANPEGSTTLYSTRTAHSLWVDTWPGVDPKERQKLIAVKQLKDGIHADLDQMTRLMRDGQENKAQSILDAVKKEQRTLYGFHAAVYEYLDVLGLMVGRPASFWDSGTENNHNASPFEHAARTVSNAPPLVHAARIGYTEGVKRMLERGAAASLSTDGAPLVVAAQNARNDIVQLLLAAGANVESTASSNNCAYRSIHYASGQGNIDLIKLLIKAGTDVNASKQCTVSPLHLAAYGTSLEAVQLLLAAGADPDMPSGVRMSSRGQLPGETPLFIAAEHERANLVVELAEHSKTVDFTDALWAGTPELIKYKDLIIGIQRKRPQPVEQRKNTQTQR